MNVENGERSRKTQTQGITNTSKHKSSEDIMNGTRTDHVNELGVR